MTWWVISDVALARALEQAHAGTDPVILIAELHANARTETTEAAAPRTDKLEALADAVRSSLDGMPDHPWIPGAHIGPVVAALKGLDGAA